MNSPTLKGAQDVDANLRLPVAMQVPAFGRLARRGKRKAADLQPIQQRCQDLVGQLLVAPKSSGGIAVGLVSVDEGSGASSIAGALAMACATDCGLRTTLVDADPSLRTTSQTFGLKNVPGLAELVDGDIPKAECGLRQDLLRVISSCSADYAQTPRLGTGDMRAIVEWLKSENDIVIFDLPAANRPTQLQSVMCELDVLLVVVESEQTLHNRCQQFLQRLQRADCQLAGVVLNKQRQYVPRWIQRLFVSGPRC